MVGHRRSLGSPAWLKICKKQYKNLELINLILKLGKIDLIKSALQLFFPQNNEKA